MPAGVRRRAGRGICRHDRCRLRGPADGQSVLTITAATAGPHRACPKPRPLGGREAGGIAASPEPDLAPARRHDFARSRTASTPSRSGRVMPRAVELRSVDLRLRGGGVAYDERAQPIGFSLMAIGFIGFMMSFRRGGRGNGGGDQQPPGPRWGRGGGRRRVNYRHAFHAGNFADVLKHVVLAAADRIPEAEGQGLSRHRHACRRWPLRPFRRWRRRRPANGATASDGFSTCRRKARPPALLAPYLDAVARRQSRRRAQALSRLAADRARPAAPAGPADRRSNFIPRMPEQLGDLFAGDHQVRVIELDGWLALGAHLPPKEKRGLVLVDPPFEQAGEFDRLADGPAKAHRRWPGGIYALWYPIKDRRRPRGLPRTFASPAFRKSSISASAFARPRTNRASTLPA